MALAKKLNIFTVFPASEDCSKTSIKENENTNYKFEKEYFIAGLFPKKHDILRITAQSSSNDAIVTSYVDGMYGPLALCIVISATFSVTMIPVHNVIQNPEYWYEITFSTLSRCFFLACCITNGAEGNLNLFKDQRMIVTLNIFITKKVSEILGLCVIHLIWSIFLGYFEPFPYKYTVTTQISNVAFVTRFWFLIPYEKRIEPSFRQKCKAYACWYLWIFIIGIQLTFILSVVSSAAQELEWIIGLILLLTKEINGYILNKITTKAALKENLDEAKFRAKIVINIAYSISYAILLTSVTKATEYCLLGISFFVNMALVYKAIQLHGKVSTTGSELHEKQKKKEDTITELVLNESIEIMVPTALIVSWCIGYYGPNKDIMGIQDCDLWHKQNVESLIDFIFPVIEMALLDSCSLIVAGGMLWWFCNVKIFEEYCKTIKKYWRDLAFIGAGYLSAWFMAYLPSIGIDKTGEYKWIYNDDQRTQMISNFTCSTYNWN